MDKHAIAEIFEEMVLLLSLKNENPFKIRAYHNAARALESSSEDLKNLIQKNTLENLPGIGKSLAEKIVVLVKTGHLPAYEKLKKSFPKGFLELLKIPGLGPKKLKILYEKLKIKTLPDLEKACKLGKIKKLKNFGKKSEENILTGISKIKEFEKRTLWWNASLLAEDLLKKLRCLKEVEKEDIAGSFRRKLETVGDLDLLVSSSKSSFVIDWFSKQPFVKKILSKGLKKASYVLQEGMHVDLRVFPKEQYPFGLLYFTGSKEHNIKMRQRALKLGYKLNEYALTPLSKNKKNLKNCSSEKEIFQLLKLPYIPPELRENLGEIEAAEKGLLPHLIEEKEIKGLFHCHTTTSDGHNTLEEMVTEAETLGLEYIGISDHSKSSFQANGMDEETLLKQIKHIEKLNRSKKFSPYIFSGIECDVLKDGSLDFSEKILKQLDFVIVSIHSLFHLDEKTQTERLIKAIEHPCTTIVGHLTGRLLLQRAPYEINISKIIDACIANGKIMELNSHPLRLDMDWRLWHQAKNKGLKCMINPDAHHASDLLFYKNGVAIARKGWLEKKDVLNTLSLQKMKDFLKKRS